MSKSKPENPVKKSKEVDSYRVLRGGGWGYTPSNARASYRNNRYPSIRHGSYGFRIARTKK